MRTKPPLSRIAIRQSVFVSRSKFILHCVLLVVALGVCFTSAGCGNSQVGAYRKQLNDDDPDQRYSALKELEDSVEASELVESVAALLADPNARIRYRAAKVLAKVGYDAHPTAPQLGKALRDSDPQVRYYAGKALASFEDKAEPATNDLIEALRDEQPKVRYYAAKSLGKIGPTALSSIPALESLAADEDESVRRAAASSLRRLRKSESS